jgi:hypothetical protein
MMGSVRSRTRNCDILDSLSSWDISAANYMNIVNSRIVYEPITCGISSQCVISLAKL